MTPPGGARDDDADNVPRDATPPLSIDPRRAPVPGHGRAAPPGSSPDDDADDARAGEPGRGPQLRAMRAVWLAMRDEDPPDRGLADLLAAARHKAEAMQPRPGAWQRLLAALRRPPVLALATVTVLIAGAVLIGRRVPHAAGPGLTASREDAAGPTRPAATGAGSSSGDLGARPEATGTYSIQPSADRGGAPAVPAPQPAAPPPAATAPPPAATALPPDRDSVRPAPPAHVPAPPPPALSSASSAPVEAARNGDDPATAGPVPETSAPAPPPRDTVSQLGASAGADTAGGSNGRAFARPPPAEPEAQPPAGASNNGRNDTAANRTANKTANNATNNAADPVANGVAEPARRPAPAPPRTDTGGDLYQQCEAAAQRGDCAVVRRLVSRIARTDRGYRARVAKDSPVGKCLAE